MNALTTLLISSSWYLPDLFCLLWGKPDSEAWCLIIHPNSCLIVTCCVLISSWVSGVMTDLEIQWIPLSAHISDLAFSDIMLLYLKQNSCWLFGEDIAPGFRKKCWFDFELMNDEFVLWWCISFTLRSGASEYHYETQVARLSCFTLIEKAHLKPRATLGENAQSTHSTNKSN